MVSAQQEAGRMIRSPGGLSFALDGYHHVESVDDRGTWDAVGNDPRFACLGNLPLPAGWYEVELDMARISGPRMWAYLYPEYGFRDLEPDKVYLPFVTDGESRHRGIVLFTHDVRSLRLDPAVAVCRFRLGGLQLRRVGKLAAAKRMIAELLRRPDGVAAKTRWGLSLLVAAITGGGSRFASALHGIYSRRPQGATQVPYETWIELYDSKTPEVLERARSAAAALPGKPAFSIILPVYNTQERWLRKCIESVQAQVYPHWELCIADDASPSPNVRRVLEEYAAADARIKVVHRERNGHISACSNTAIGIAGGEWLVLLDHDDELHPLALSEMAVAINANPRWRLIYSDEDKIDEDGFRFDPYMKPDWNYDLLLSHNCISHLGVYDASLVREVGGFREGFEGSQDWDLAFRCIERLEDGQVGHVPKVLYHWRAIEGSTALAPQEKDYAHLAGRRAIAGHLERTNPAASVHDIPGQRGNYRVRYALPGLPLVSIVIPTRDGVDLLRACIDSVVATSTYPRYEILVVDNQSRDPETLAYFAELAEDPRVRLIPYDAPFNYSAINNHAVAQAAGEVICLLNNDITVISPDWLEEMAGHACRPGVGAVGAMLYYPNDTIQHAGVVVGAHGVAAHAYSGEMRGHPGHMSRARLTQSLTAVTAACLVVHRNAYDAVGGFDPSLQVAFNDVDFCLRLVAAGYRNVWTPFAELYHHESASRGYEDSPEKIERFKREVDFMHQRWGAIIEHDPAYSLNHTTDDQLFQLAFPPRTPGASKTGAQADGQAASR